MNILCEVEHNGCWTVAGFWLFRVWCDAFKCLNLFLLLTLLSFHICQSVCLTLWHLPTLAVILPCCRQVALAEFPCCQPYFATFQFLSIAVTTTMVTCGTNGKSKVKSLRCIEHLFSCFVCIVTMMWKTIELRVHKTKHMFTWEHRQNNVNNRRK